MLSSFLTLLYNIFINPITIIIASILNILNEAGLSEGWAIIVLSLIINTLILPLYALSERIQTKERTIRKRLDDVVTRLKTVYKGVTLHFLTQYWYKQQGYHPIYALRSLLGFLIQVPFFIAAYQYIGHWHKLEGKHFLFLSDLSKPDALLLGINLLPIVMTALNLASAFIYSKNLQRQDKIQLLTLSLVFFVLLYAMPSGLLLYWTINNLYSLFKNIFTHSIPFHKFQPNFGIPGIKNLLEKTSFAPSKMKKFPSMVKWIDVFVWLGFTLCFFGYIAYFDRSIHLPTHTYFLWGCFLFSGILAFNGVVYFFFYERPLKNWASLSDFLLKLVLLLFMLLATFFILRELIIDNHLFAPDYSYNVKILWYDDVIFLLLLISLYKYAPVLLSVLPKIFPKDLISDRERNALFFFSFSLILSILFVYSPLNIISSDVDSFNSQTVVNGFNNYLSAGIAVLILGSIFYLLLKNKENSHSFVIILTFLAHTFILFNLLPVPSVSIYQMEFENLPAYNMTYFFRDILVFILAFFISYWTLRKKKSSFLISLYALISLSYLGIAFYYQKKNEVVTLNHPKQNPSENKTVNANSEKIGFSAKDNIILIFTDRFYGGYMPLLLKDDPSIANKLEGFTWYPNTGSYGNETFSGMPASLAGYHYEARNWYKEYAPHGPHQGDYYIKTLPQLLESLFYNMHRNNYSVGVNFDYSAPGCSGFNDKIDGKEKITPDECITLEESSFRSPKEFLFRKYAEQFFNFALSLIKNSPYFLKKFIAYHWSERYSSFPYQVYSAATGLKPHCWGVDTNKCFFIEEGKPIKLDLINGKKIELSYSSYKMLPYLALYNLPEKTALDKNLSHRFIFIDSMLTHRPGSVNYDCDPSDTSFRQEERTLFKDHELSIQHFYTYKCAIYTLNRWFDVLKKEGAYDNSTILWFADHGMRNYFDPQNMKSLDEITTPDTNPPETETVLKGSFNPILLVKPKNAHGLLKVSTEPKMNADIVANFLCDELATPCYNPFLKEPYLKKDPYDEPNWVVRGTGQYTNIFYKIPKTGMLSAPLHLEKAPFPTKN